jgi:serine/threonine-protein kinase
VNTDRDLLFGALALQLDFITKGQLVAALSACASAGARPLGEALVEQGILSPEQHDRLTSLVQERLKQHGNDPGKSLDSFDTLTLNRNDLAALRDRGAQASVSSVPAVLPPDHIDSQVLHDPPDRFGTQIVPPGGAGSPLRPAAPAADRFATQMPDAPVRASGPAPAVGASSSSSQRFRVLRPHARGGLGEVLLALDQELHREVALKQIQDRHADSIESRLRFLLEAEITGGLEHPGIVPVYALGVYEDGRPYYAMRFIRGESFKEAIERFHAGDGPSGRNATEGVPYRARLASERSLELRQLLGRFIDVCNAIAYAHARGIVHRDLKPANVMLGKYGETLVVDWGLAKPVDRSAVREEAPEGALMPSSAEASMGTMLGSSVGTPQFMSPEQAAGRTDQLGPASDVYSLGATLYALLTGQPAVGGTDVGAILWQVQLGMFPRPSQIKPGVPRALEAVCLKAMALRPEDRYASARDLADDVEHWLADEPVSAWREPWAVRARRWVSRHRTLVTGAATALLVAVVGLTIATGLLEAANGRERQARATAEANEREAHEQRERAERNYRLARQNEREANKQRARAEGNYRFARQAVDRYHTHVSEDILLKEPGLQPLRKKLLEDAREFYEKFVQEPGQGPDAQADLGKALYRLAQITGEIDSLHKAIELHSRALSIFTALAAERQGEPERQADLADCEHHLGRLYRLTDQLAPAEDFGRRAVADWDRLARDHPGEDRYRAERARSRNVLANVYQMKRDLKKAVAADTAALAVWSELVKKDRGNAERQRYLALSYNHLGMVYNDTGERKKAKDAFGRSLEIRKKLAGAHPQVSKYQDDLASTHFNLGDLYAQLGEPKRAEGPFAEAARLWKDLVDKHPTVVRFQAVLAEAYSALARVHLEASDPGRAEEACRQALPLREKLAADHPKVPAYEIALAESHFRLGDVHRARRKVAEAEKAYREALRIQEGVVKAVPAVPFYRAEAARTCNNLALLYLGDRQWGPAEAAYRKALGHWERAAQASPWEVEYARGLAATCYNLGNLRADRGEPGEALDWYARALAAIEDRFKPGQWSPAMRQSLGNTLKERAEALTKLGRHRDALRDWDRALALAEPAQRPPLELYRALTLARTGDHAEAAAKADELAPKAARSGPGSYLLARVYAASAAAAKEAGLVERYARRAVRSLEAARKVKFFQVPANVERLAGDTDLAALRGRKDFEALLEAVRGKVGP